MRIYVVCLASYNAGKNHGRWLDLTYLTAEDIGSDIAALLATSPTPNAEEWAIHDWEGIPVSENESFDRLAELAEAVEKFTTDVVRAALRVGIAIEDIEDCRRGCWDSFQDYIEDYVEQSGMMAEVPQHLHRYFNMEAYAYDAASDYHIVAIDSGVVIFTASIVSYPNNEVSERVSESGMRAQHRAMLRE